MVQQHATHARVSHRIGPVAGWPAAWPVQARRARPRRWPTCWRAALLWAAAGAAQAQFAAVPAPQLAQRWHSPAESALAYRADAARHLYASYPWRVYQGRLPPQLYGVAVVDTELDADGRVLAVQLRRAPAAAELGPWILQMIQRAAPFPALARLGHTRYTDVWLVHRDGNFQLDTLTEGQD